MTQSPRLVRVRHFALGLAAAAIHVGAWGPPSAAGWCPQAGRPAQTPAAARDPFLPLPERSAEPRRVAPQRSRGLAGLRVGELEVVGIVATADARLAVLEAPDGRTYVARVSDHLADGVVREVAEDSVLFTLSRTDGREGTGPGREMRKTLGDRSGGP